MRITNVFVASCLIGTTSVANAGDPTISISGDCPGQVQVQWSGASPHRLAALWFSPELGQFTLPAGPCSGAVLGLGPEGLRVARHYRTGPDGEGAIRGYAAPIACGGYLQMLVDGGPCVTSNVVQIP